MEPLTHSLTVVMSRSYPTHHFTMANIFRILTMKLTNPNMIEVLYGLACCLKEVLNPKFHCVMCSKACKTECIACDECNQWVHRTCIGMSTTEFSRLGRSEEARSFVKNTGQEATGVSPLKNKDGFLKSDSTSKANILNNQFVSVFTKEDTGSLPDKGPSPYPSMPNIEVNWKGVHKLLKGIKPFKATRPDSSIYS